MRERVLFCLTRPSGLVYLLLAQRTSLVTELSTIIAALVPVKLVQHSGSLIHGSRSWPAYCCNRSVSRLLPVVSSLRFLQMLKCFVCSRSHLAGPSSKCRAPTALPFSLSFQPPRVVSRCCKYRSTFMGRSVHTAEHTQRHSSSIVYTNDFLSYPAFVSHRHILLKEPTILYLSWVAFVPPVSFGTSPSSCKISSTCQVILDITAPMFHLQSVRVVAVVPFRVALNSVALS